MIWLKRVKQAWRLLPAFCHRQTVKFSVDAGDATLYTPNLQSSLHQIANYEDTMSTAGRGDEEVKKGKKEFFSTPRKDFNEQNMRLHWKTFQSEDELN